MKKTTKLNQGDKPAHFDFLTVQEMADYLRLCEKQVRRLISSGELPAHQFGTALRIKKEDRDAYVEARRVIPVKKKA